ncbi:MAG TPA: ABC transporter permease subunit [Armatimonadota bacterium]|nr:ABC transporter permease subunit [Armatimonadota bacterium]HOM80546.1 ABC transporter permease subunit [Armatimonadota bacterium]HPO71409.1 ABC transporter permease subunit [Armatimonadota bacterium]HPT97773.1 ABC transporter permease subunit [Armatimonadota bacterium]
MKNAIVIMRRELHSYFTSTIAYSVAAFFLLICGYLFFATVKVTQEATLLYLFHNAAVTLLLISPAMTMRLVAEERRSGSIELLMTAPVTDTQVIIGKYLGALVFYASMLLLTLQYPIILLRLGSPDGGPMLTGYIGLFLLGAAFLAIGLVASTLTKNQIVAAVGAFSVMLILWVISWVGSTGASSTWSEVLRQLSLLDRFGNFTKGLIDSRDVIFFLSIIGFCLFLSVRALGAVKSR